MPVATISLLDSDRFGITVARANDVTPESLHDLLVFCESNEVEMVIARCNGSDLAAAKAMTAAGLTALEFQIAFKGPVKPLWDPTIRVGRPEDQEQVAALASVGFDQLVGHYHADPRLDPRACREAYCDWALRGLAGEAAGVFYVVEEEDRLQAFGMFNEEGGEAVYVLATVDPDARGRGLYLALLRHGMAWAADRGALEITGVVAHGNIAPQRNLLKAGMLPMAATTTFHGWRDQLMRNP